MKISILILLLFSATVDLAVGSYRLIVEKKYYMPVIQEVLINDGEVTELHIKLEKGNRKEE